ncbi:prephenate dehydrogenase/arogenate dehydrogenase family protein [Conexivisphaera calida]|uniref:Arogenate dehydrogenase n=1 Tax=Conexivisphaera calida TaxID=1874277 RepID=A0A4P2VHI1_9ARCH|nr:prephenate dehydrogenase/arogenate dehydrogenase family protein [Conexivisphaera calida]BBE42672.1 Arogenate dehydrogenase [Conexivisphaera calida]
MRILVLGLGRMGLLLASALSSAGHEVRGYDPSGVARERASLSGISIVESPEPEDYDAVLAAVPLDRSPAIAREMCPRIRRGGIYADVSTLKAEVNTVLRSIGPGAIKVSVHPLFGRGASGIVGRPIVLTPVEDADRESGAAAGLFRGAKIIVMDESEHDDAVARSIALPHLLGYLFRAASREGPSIPSTSRRLQELAAAVEVEDPELTAQLISRSPAAARVLRDLEEALSAIRSAGDPAQILRSLRDDWSDRESLYELAYRALDSL